MNKIIHTVLFLFCALCFASAQENTFEKVIKHKDSLRKEEQKTVYYNAAERGDFARWSYQLHVGVSYFDGNDYNINGSPLQPSVRVLPTAGISLEYSFNPVLGMGWQYSYLPYGVNFKPADYKLRGASHEIDMFLSVNILNLFTRYRSQKWNLYGDIGAGISIYNAGDLQGATLTVPLAVQLEYNINKNIAVGLKGETRYHATGKLKGYENANESVFPFDGFRAISLTFRHKIQGKKLRHVRNVSYSNEEVVKLVKEREVLRTRVEKGKKDSVQLVKVTEKLDNVVEKRPDTVIVVKESERVVVEKMLEEQDREVFKRALRGIQFEYGTAEISRVSLPLLADIALIMQHNPSYELDVVCHTDNTGSEKENLDLSVKRANVVKANLVKLGVEASRIAAAGLGAYSPVASNNTPIGRSLNRRTEFIIKSGNQILHK